MEFALGTLAKNLIFTGILGGIGGLALGLLQEKGLELPHLNKENGIKFYDFGFLADVLIGVIAAIIVYALNPPIEISELLSSAITSGIGGSAILKGYVKGTGGREHANRAENYRLAAVDASKGIDIKSRLDELAEVDKLVKRRWGTR